MPYNKTTWNEGGPPGISAANLNNLESQYDAVKAELADNTGELWDALRTADGAGSGLDADLLRGVPGNHLMRWVQPGDTILLEALTEKSKSDMNRDVVKAFSVVRPGRYRITGDARSSSSSSSNFLSVVVMGSTEDHTVTVGSFSTTSTTYVTFAIDMTKPAPAGGIIGIVMQINNATAFIQNVRLRYADAANPDNPSVVID